MGSQAYFLQIQNPCNEDWHHMQPGETGRYCTFCAKTVIDFTKLTDEQIIEMLKEGGGKLCGRLNASQLNRPFTGPNTRRHRLTRLKEVFATLLLLAGTGEILRAKAVPEKLTIVSIPQYSNNGIEKRKEDGDTIVVYKCKGQVIDSSSNEPINAVIENKSRHTGELSDDSGHFEITVYLGDILSVTSIGYQSTEIIISGPKINKVIALKPDLGFGVQMVGAVSYRHPVWHRIKYFFRNLVKHKPKG